MSMRVLHIVPALFGAGGVFGGGERYALGMAQEMANRVPTTLLTFGDAPREEQRGALRVRVAGPAHYVRGQRYNPLHPALVEEALKHDVVHCHQKHILASSLTAMLCRATGRNVVVSDLGGGGSDISRYVSTDALFDAHLHISEFSRRTFGHAERANAHVVFGGVDTELFSPDPSAKRDGTVLYVGRVLPHKGVNDLVDAADPTDHVELIGQVNEPRFRADLLRRAEGKDVQLRDDVDDAGIVNAYRRARCIVLPSVYKDLYGVDYVVPELLGQTLIEGMACGTPAICTDVASMPELVVDGVTGFVVPPNDPRTLGARLRWLREHDDEARKMGDAARARVLEKFTWPAVIDRCLAAYEDLARAPRALRVLRRVVSRVSAPLRA